MMQMNLKKIITPCRLGVMMLLQAMLVTLVTGCSSGGGGGGGTAGGLIIATWAGEGTQGFDGDGMNRTASWFNSPMEMTFGPDGLAYIVDWNNHRIRRVKSDGTLETLIGVSLPGDWPCQNPADPSNCVVPLNGTVAGTELGFNHPMDLIFAPDGTAIIAAWHNHKVVQYNPSTGTVTIVAGQMVPGFTGDGGAGLDATMNFPDSIVIDANGNILVSDERSNRVRRIANDAGYTITTVAGSSSPATVSGYGGDGGPATAAVLALTAYNEAGGSDNPPAGGGLAMDVQGNLYIADTFNHCIRKVIPGPDGIIGEGDPAKELITTFAGKCGETLNGFSGDDGAAADARFSGPHDLDFGPDGRLYIADTHNHAVRAVDLTSRKIELVAGTGGSAGFSGDGEVATKAKLNKPYGIAFDNEGNLYIVDRDNNRIRIVLVTGSTVTTAPAVSLSASPGTGIPPLNVSFTATASDPDGGVIVDYDWDFGDGDSVSGGTQSNPFHTYGTEGFYTVRVQVTDDEGQTAKASITVTASGTGGDSCPDTGPGLPTGESGTIATLAGTGVQATDQVDADNDGEVDCPIPADEASFDIPMDIKIGPDGRFYISDWNGHKIRALDSNGLVSFVVGTGIEGDACETALNPDGTCPAHFTQINHPTGVGFDSEGKMLVAAWHNSKIKRLDFNTNSVEDICGDGGRAFKGDGGPCIDILGNDLVSFDLPSSVVYDLFGNLFLSDQANQVIRRIGTDGIINTVAGNCPVQAAFGCIQGQGYDGDGGPATDAHITNNLNQGTDPQGKIRFGPDGSLYIADTGNNAIRKVVPGPDGIIGGGNPSDEIITTIAGTGFSGFTSDGVPATSALMNQPREVAVAPDGTFYIADTLNNCVRKVDPSGVISTVAGQCGKPGGFAGDGFQATDALLLRPYGVELDSEENLYIVDTFNNRIRVVFK
jgi:trimeric autotransporter adhesin